MSSAALVGTDGSIDWCCFPRFDSPSVFAAILDEDVGGRFKISPAGTVLESSQKYLPDTNILETTFRTENGLVSITDFMPVTDDDDPATLPVHLHEIHRIRHVPCGGGADAMRLPAPPQLRPQHSGIPHATGQHGGGGARRTPDHDIAGKRAHVRRRERWILKLRTHRRA